MHELDLTLARRRGGETLSLTGQMLAMMAGTDAIAWDFTAPSTMWKEDIKTNQVTAALDPIGAFRTIGGATQIDIIQATAGNRPAWDGTRFAVPDGTDFLSFNGSINLLRNKPAYYIALRHGGTHNNNAFLSISSTTAGTSRFLFAGSTGAVNVNVRRAEGDLNSSRTSVSTAMLTGSTIAFDQDLSTDGICALYRDNVFVENLAAIGGTLGPGEDTATSRIVFFANMSQAFPATGSAGRGCILPWKTTAPQRALSQAWMIEV
jgi:hypothetical protein